jgi:hypothetical protein
MKINDLKLGGRTLMEKAAQRILNAARKENIGISWIQRTYEGEEHCSLEFYNGISGIATLPLYRTGLITATTQTKAMQFLLKHTDVCKIGRVFNGLFDGATSLGHVFLYAYVVTGEQLYLKLRKMIAS